jgi:outer membrane murein-binding lipoprotein Lpp
MLGLKGMLIVGGIAAVAISGLLVRDHFQTQRLNAMKRDNATLTATVANLEQLRDIATADAKAAQEASNAFSQRLADIERDARERPIRVRVCPTVRSVPAEGIAAARADEAGAGRVDGPVEEVDLTPYARDCAAVAEQLTALQAWEAARTH